MVEGGTQRRTAIAVERGLYVLRYTACPDASAPSLVRFAPSAHCSSTIQIVSAPGAVPGELSAPGDAAVVVSSASGSLEVVIQSRAAGGSTDVSLSLDRLGARSMNNGVAPAAVQAQPQPAAPVLGRMLCHVSRRGDVVVPSGAWAGGPAAPAPIEGIQVDLAANLPVRLEYSVALVGADGWSNWVPAGAFAGTRGRARPLSGVRFRLSSGGQGQYEIEAEALYLGAPVDRKTGTELEFRAVSSQDALVGLRFAVVAARGAGTGYASQFGGQLASVQRAPPVLPQADGGRIKVFRAAGVR